MLYKFDINTPPIQSFSDKAMASASSSKSTDTQLNNKRKRDDNNEECCICFHTINGRAVVTTACCAKQVCYECHLKCEKCPLCRGDMLKTTKKKKGNGMCVKEFNMSNIILDVIHGVRFHMQVCIAMNIIIDDMLVI